MFARPNTLHFLADKGPRPEARLIVLAAGISVYF
jgi:hypothetical protein